VQLGFRDRNAGFITLFAAYLSNDNFLMRNCKMIIQARLKEILHYSPETGLFIWLVSLSNRIKAGDDAGFINDISLYRTITVSGKMYQAHRLAWLYVYGVWPEYIDHINHNRSYN